MELVEAWIPDSIQTADLPAGKILCPITPGNGNIPETFHLQLLLLYKSVLKIALSWASGLPFPRLKTASSALSGACGKGGEEKESGRKALLFI